MNKIKVDLDELLDKLEQVKDEDYATVEIEISDETYDRNLVIRAIGLDVDDKDDFLMVSEIEDI